VSGAGCCGQAGCVAALRALPGAGGLPGRGLPLPPAPRRPGGGGAPAPDFTLETLDGGKLSLSDLRGKAVLINFWTTWCPECKDELPALEAFQRRWGHRIALLGVNMRETEGLVRPFVQRYGVTYPILLDRFERVSKVYQVTGVPETWLVDADGIAVARFIGPLTEAHLARAVELLLGDEAAGGPGESGPGGAS